MTDEYTPEDANVITLTDEEADAAMKRAIKALDKLGISLRS